MHRDEYKPVPAYPHPDDTESRAVVSTTECTGLMQTPPLDEDEAEGYADLYNYAPGKDKAKEDEGPPANP